MHDGLPGQVEHLRPERGAGCIERNDVVLRIARGTIDASGKYTLECAHPMYCIELLVALRAMDLDAHRPNLARTRVGVLAHTVLQALGPDLGSQHPPRVLEGCEQLGLQMGVDPGRPAQFCALVLHPVEGPDRAAFCVFAVLQRHGGAGIHGAEEVGRDRLGRRRQNRGTDPVEALDAMYQSRGGKCLPEGRCFSAQVVLRERHVGFRDPELIEHLGRGQAAGRPGHRGHLRDVRDIGINDVFVERVGVRRDAQVTNGVYGVAKPCLRSQRRANRHDVESKLGSEITGAIAGGYRRIVRQLGGTERAIAEKPRGRGHRVVFAVPLRGDLLRNLALARKIAVPSAARSLHRPCQIRRKLEGSIEPSLNEHVRPRRQGRVFVGGEVRPRDRPRILGQVGLKACGAGCRRHVVL